MPDGTDVTALIPTIAITGTSVIPASGVAQNFTSPVDYMVTAADSSTQVYVVAVTIADSLPHFNMSGTSRNIVTGALISPAINFIGPSNFTTTSSGGNYNTNNFGLEGLYDSVSAVLTSFKNATIIPNVNFSGSITQDFYLIPNTYNKIRYIVLHPTKTTWLFSVLSSELILPDGAVVANVCINRPTGSCLQSYNGVLMSDFSYNTNNQNETTMIGYYVTGTYQFYVDKFFTNPTSGDFANDVIVSVWDGAGNLEKQYVADATASSGKNYWHVFDINGTGVITDVNQYTTTR